MSEVLNSTLFKLGVGVLVALFVRVALKKNGQEVHENLLAELRTLLPLGALAGVAMLAAGEPWMSVVESFLLAIAVPLGLNSKSPSSPPKAEEEAEDHGETS